MKTTPKKIQGDLESLIREKRSELQRLEAAQSVLTGGSDTKRVTAQKKAVARRRKPSADAIRAGKVSTGGRLNGYRKHILSELKRHDTGMTTAQIGKRLFEPGLGVTRSKFDKKISSTLHHMRKTNAISSIKQNGTREVLWKAAERKPTKS